jgi:hypothetical protein
MTNGHFSYTRISTTLTDVTRFGRTKVILKPTLQSLSGPSKWRV